MLRPAARETGFWRPQPDGELEVLITHATGITEIFYGRARNLTSWEIKTDAVVRTASAKDVVAARTGSTGSSRAATSPTSTSGRWMGQPLPAAPLGSAEPHRRLGGS